MMKKEEIQRFVGSMQQVAYARKVCYQEGRAAGLNAVEVRNGALDFQVLTDKCLDLGSLSYKGVNFSFLSKPGLQGRNHYDTNGEEAIRSIMGGMMFTSGLESICAPCRIDGVDYPMHGRMRTTPAEHVCSDARWTEQGYELSVSGEMREAALFGENLVLRRSITSVYGEKSLTITDEFENEAFREEPLMLLYHINFGYPLMNQDTQIVIPTDRVTARDEDAKGHEDRYDRMDEPKENEKEYVFIHDIRKSADGWTGAAVVNHSLGLGLMISWTTGNLPYFMEWKSTAAGDYVIGLEPANSSVYGRPFHEKDGSVHKIAPFAKEKNILRFTVLDGPEEIGRALEKIKEI